MKRPPPWSRTRSTQPQSVTSCWTLSLLSSPQVCVRSTMAPGWLGRELDGAAENWLPEIRSKAEQYRTICTKRKARPAWEGKGNAKVHSWTKSNDNSDLIGQLLRTSPSRGSDRRVEIWLAVAGVARLQDPRLKSATPATQKSKATPPTCLATFP